MTYVYYCPACGVHHDLSFSIWDDRSDVCCPDCGMRMQRVFTAINVQLNGSGWGAEKTGLPDVGKSYK